MDLTVHKVLLFDNFALDLTRGCLRAGDQNIDLRPKTFEVMRYLAENAGRLIPKQELSEAVWPNVVVTDDSLVQCIRELREKLGDDEHRLIKTVVRRGYLLDVPISADDGRAVRAPQTTRASAEIESAPALPLPSRASIAVLPFTNLGGHPDQEYFSDGITEDIITELSRFSELFVIARNSSFQYKGKVVDVRRIARELGVHYLLEGSIRRAGQHMRITAQLIDAQAGAHRWADRYDRRVEDVFAVQAEVAHTVSALLAAHVSKAEAERAALKPPATWEAYDYYLRAADAYAVFFRLMQVTAIFEARRFLDECSAIDPNFARAHVLQSATKITTWAQPLDGDYLNPAALDAAHRSAETAIQLGPNLPQAHSQLACVLSFKGQSEAAVAEVERATALNSNFTDWRFVLVLVHAGQSERAIDAAKTHLRLDPFALPVARGFMGLAYYMLRRYPEAVATLREFVSQSPNHRPGRAWLTATYAQMGRFEDARREAAELLRIYPGWTISGIFRKGGYLRDEDVEHLTDGLRKAGLRER